MMAKYNRQGKGYLIYYKLEKRALERDFKIFAVTAFNVLYNFIKMLIEDYEASNNIYSFLQNSSQILLTKVALFQILLRKLMIQMSPPGNDCQFPVSHISKDR